MSGGSLNYMYEKDHPEMTSDFRYAVEYLKEHYPDSMARIISEAMMNKPEPPDELREVWRCIEWNLSSDYSEAQVLEAVLAFEKFYSTREFHKCINRYGREVSVVVFVPEMLCRGGTPSELLEKLSISLHAHAKKFIKEATL